LIITDRDELDEQFERVFSDVREEIYRTKSGADLIAKLNATTPWLLCSLITSSAAERTAQRRRAA
jgi:type I restriction enzyme R subunit